MPLLAISHQQQRQQSDCLAACAEMVLTYLGQPTNYDQLIILLRIGPAGAPFRNLNHLAKLGVTVTIESGTIATIQSYLNQAIPPIVFVATQELSYWSETTNHAVVVAGLDDQNIYLYDPAFTYAPHTVPIAEFDLAWLEMGEFLATVK